jgi:hypothetical protein
MKQTKIQYINEMKAIKAIDELIALAQKCKNEIYGGDFFEARYDMSLIKRGSVFALEAIDKIKEDQK